MIHHVYANRSNAGDWLSALGIQSLVGGQPVVEHLCDGPFVASTIADLDRLGTSDLIVIGGGGLFMNYFTPFWTQFAPIAHRVPFCVWGAGACDMVNGSSLPPSELVREIAGAARLCVVRDELTRSLLSLDGLPDPVPCPTFVAVPSAGTNGTGVVLHVDHFDNVGPAVFEQMEAFAAAHAKATGRRHRKTNNLLAAGNRKGLADILELYRSADLVLTSRLHGCIISAALGRPFVAVSADRKVDAFMQAAGLERWLCSLEAVDTLPQMLADLDRERPLAGAFAESVRERNREVAERVRTLIAEAAG